jgi:DNA-binding NtrC family response regulator
MGQPLPQLDERAATRIEKASWHGNLRQMRAVLGAAVAGHAGNGPISAAEIDVPLQLRTAEGHAADETGAALRPWIDSTLRTGRLSLPELETEAYRAAVAQSSGNLSAAARLLGITRAQLAYRLKARTE